MLSSVSSWPCGNLPGRAPVRIYPPAGSPCSAHPGIVLGTVAGMPLTMLSSRRLRWLRVRAHDDLELAFTLPRNMQSAELGSADVHSGQETDRAATLDRQSGGTASGVCESATDQGNVRQASAAEEGRVDRAESCALLRYRRNAQDSLRQLLKRLNQIDVLVIDDWAMAPMLEPERRDFWEIAEDRYQTRSMILTSQLPVSRWHEQIGDPTLADGILDRLVHHAHRIEMRGESMRKPRREKGEK